MKGLFFSIAIIGVVILLLQYSLSTSCSRPTEKLNADEVGAGIVIIDNHKFIATENGIGGWTLTWYGE